jgi:curved DNA-binding protein CbpA
MMLRGNHYQVLTLKPGASLEEVDNAYRLCSVLYRGENPGTNAADIMAARARIEEAYSVLSDPSRREEYDRQHGFPSPPPRLMLAPPASGPGTVAGPASHAGAPQPVFPMRVPEPRPAPVPRALAAPVAPRPQPVTPTGPVGGAELRKMREEHGVTLEHIAAVTKVSVRVWQDIENERFDRLPAPVYIRSFVQQYAREVGLEPRAAADGYLRRVRR